MYGGFIYYRSGIKQIVDVFNIIERIIYKKRQIGNNPHLFANPEGKLMPDFFFGFVDALKNFFLIACPEKAQVNSCKGKIGRNTHFGYRNQKPLQVVAGHKLKYFTEVFLQQA